MHKETGMMDILEDKADENILIVTGHGWKFYIWRQTLNKKNSTMIQSLWGSVIGSIVLARILMHQKLVY